jgi:DNA invertase Pin-like site-specific DNA recombinase
VLVVWRLDRLGRSMSELLRLTAELEANGVGLESLKEKIDTTSAAGRVVFHVLAALAEFERNLIRERTFAGLDAARARGRKGGRPGVAPETIAAIQALAGDHSRSPAEICKALNISRSTLYKYRQGSK